MSKFYAVRVGKVPGIYTSWPECSKNVTGFSGSVFKSFLTKQDAETFMGGCQKKEELETKQNEKNVIEVFTDGSHKKHEKNGHLGVGIFCRYIDEEYEYSLPITKDSLEREGIGRESTVSNPTCEFLAYKELLRLLYSCGKDLSKYTFLVKIDYEGVDNWMNSSWRCNEEYIKKIKTSCDNYLSKLKCKIIIQHVPSHCGIYGNERVDQLAKSEVYKNTFSKLFEKL